MLRGWTRRQFKIWDGASVAPSAAGTGVLKGCNTHHRNIGCRDKICVMGARATMCRQALLSDVCTVSVVMTAKLSLHYLILKL